MGRVEDGERWRERSMARGRGLLREGEIESGCLNIERGMERKTNLFHRHMLKFSSETGGGIPLISQLCALNRNEAQEQKAISAGIHQY